MTYLREPETGFADVNGTQIYYEVLGEGYPLVLIHNGLLDNRLWDEQFQAFAEHFQVIRYDIRGFGDTPMPENLLYSNVEDLFELLEFLGIKRAHVLGLSLGASIALDFTLEYPEMVSALILASPFVSGYDNFSPESLERSEALAQLVEQEDADGLFDFWSNDPAMPREREFPKAHSRFLELLSEYSFQHYLDPERQRPINPPALERMMEVRVPTLVIVGDKDTDDTLAIADLLEAGIIDVKKVVLLGARQLLNLERPEQFNRLVDTFLKRL